MPKPETYTEGLFPVPGNDSPVRVRFGRAQCILYTVLQYVLHPPCFSAKFALRIYLLYFFLLPRQLSVGLKVPKCQRVCQKLLNKFMQELSESWIVGGQGSKERSIFSFPDPPIIQRLWSWQHPCSHFKGVPHMPSWYMHKTIWPLNAQQLPKSWVTGGVWKFIFNFEYTCWGLI